MLLAVLIACLVVSLVGLGILLFFRPKTAQEAAEKAAEKAVEEALKRVI